MKMDALVGRFARAQEGGLAVTFAIALALMCGAAGVAIDFGRLVSARSSVQAAVDGATLAAAAEVGDGRLETAENVFHSYLDRNVDRSILHRAQLQPTYSLQDGNKVVATASAAIDASLTSVFGFHTLPFDVQSEAKVDGTYADIHILIDTTASMNIPDSVAGVQKLVSIFKPYNSGGCAFACHGPDGSGSGLYDGRTGYSYAKEAGIYLREDRLRDSLLGMIDKIAEAPAAPNMRVSLDIISGTVPKSLVKKADLQTAREAIKTIPFKVNTASISNVLASYAKNFSKAGTGTVLDPRQYAIIITDGVSHLSATDKPEILNTAGCDKLKAIGIQPYVLNITYPKSNYAIGDDAKLRQFWGAIQAAPAALASCAGADTYYDAYEGEQISEALSQIADQLALRQTALTK